jgi:small neutral amino acid transporter SnatA (MarC family)
MGWVWSAFFLLLLTFTGGFVVLLLRLVASWGGPFSRLFGKFGGEVFAQFVGWVLTPIALWMAVNVTINVFELGVF